eukprot:11004116-Alexandrium_andersonii.AAC.1
MCIRDRRPRAHEGYDCERAAALHLRHQLLFGPQGPSLQKMHALQRGRDLGQQFEQELHRHVRAHAQQHL